MFLNEREENKPQEKSNTKQKNPFEAIERKGFEEQRGNFLQEIS